jgi:hypothetical protein
MKSRLSLSGEAYQNTYTILTQSMGRLYQIIYFQLDKNGGPGRDRTDDLFHAMEARSQLRHRPTFAEGMTLRNCERLSYSLPAAWLSQTRAGATRGSSRLA